MTYGHPPKLKPIGYDSSTFSTLVIRNGNPKRLNFSANFRDSYGELMPKLWEVSPNIGNFKESEKAQECSDVWCLNACNQSRKGKFRENNSSTCNHQQCGHNQTSQLPSIISTLLHTPDRINVDRQYIKHCPGLSYLLTCNF